MSSPSYVLPYLIENFTACPESLVVYKLTIILDTAGVNQSTDVSGLTVEH